MADSGRGRTPGQGPELLTAVGAISVLAVSVITGALFALQRARLAEPGGAGSEEVFETLELYSQLFPAIELAAAGVFIVGALLLAGRGAAKGRAAWPIVAATSLGAAQGVSVWIWVATLREEYESLIFELLSETWFSVTMGLLSSFAWIVMGGLVLSRRSRASGISAPLAIYAGLLALSGLFWIVRSMQLVDIESPMVHFMAGHGPTAIAAGILVHQVLRSRPTSPPDPGALADASWEQVASGLSIYANALLWKLAVSVGAYLLLFVAGTSRSAGLAKFVMAVHPFLSIVIGVAILVGIYRYALQPASSPARLPAWLGFAAMLVAACLQSYVFLQILPLLTAESGDLSAALDAREAAESAQGVALWAMGVGFAGLLFILVSFAQLAHHLRRPDLSRRVGVLTAVLLCAGAAIVGLRSYLQGAPGGIGEIAILGILALVGAAALLFAYVRLVTALEAAVREGDAGGVPPARLV